RERSPDRSRTWSAATSRSSCRSRPPWKKRPRASASTSPRSGENAVAGDWTDPRRARRPSAAGVVHRRHSLVARTAMGAVRDFVVRHFRHFNAAALVDAAKAWEAHLATGGEMMLTMGGAMRTAAPAVR